MNRKAIKATHNPSIEIDQCETVHTEYYMGQLKKGDCIGKPKEKVHGRLELLHSLLLI